MDPLFQQSELPSHLFAIPELNLFDDLFRPALRGEWFRLGAKTILPKRDRRNVEEIINRESALIAQADFLTVFDELDSIGGVFSSLGYPTGALYGFNAPDREYRYWPFHRYEIGRNGQACEPLAFFVSQNKATIFINPDIELYFRLEMRDSDHDSWWDPRRDLEVMKRQLIDDNTVEIVTIRVSYLQEYMKARQMSLLIGHYQHRDLLYPKAEIEQSFVSDNAEIAFPDRKIKLLLENYMPDNPLSPGPRLLRRMHLWFLVPPPAIDMTDPWSEELPFDLCSFTLPTAVGPVAPGRWRSSHRGDNEEFDGVAGNFLEDVYFKQEVLSHYESAHGFEVRDDGSVSCGYHWGLERSTRRVGNEFVVTYIGDFAEGVPLAEWPHWQKYAVEPPSREELRMAYEEVDIPEAINLLYKKLIDLNKVVARFSSLLMPLEARQSPLWSMDPGSISARKLKHVYPGNENQDEFVQRVTALNTIVVDGLSSVVLRRIMASVDNKLTKDETESKPVGSLKLLERMIFVAEVMRRYGKVEKELSVLVWQTMWDAQPDAEEDIEVANELQDIYQRARKAMKPLFCLYDFRIHGGVAHRESRKKVDEAVTRWGLPKGGWQRKHYLEAIASVSDSVVQCQRALSQAIEAGGLWNWNPK